MNQDASTNNQPTPTRPQPAESANSELRPLPRPLIYRTDPIEIEVEEAELWAMTVQERIDAMWARRLTRTQLRAWSGRHSEQVPSIGGEYAYIVMDTPEYHDDDCAQDSGSVVAFRAREEVRDVAA